MNNDQYWSSWTLLDTKRAKTLVTQLKREIGPEHQLIDIIENVEVFAADTATDDILVSDPANALSAYGVHLTWSQTPEIDANFPTVKPVSRSTLPRIFI